MMISCERNMESFKWGVKIARILFSSKIIRVIICIFPTKLRGSNYNFASNSQPLVLPIVACMVAAILPIDTCVRFERFLVRFGFGSERNVNNLSFENKQLLLTQLTVAINMIWVLHLIVSISISTKGPYSSNKSPDSPIVLQVFSVGCVFVRFSSKKIPKERFELHYLPPTHFWWKFGVQRRENFFFRAKIKNFPTNWNRDFQLFLTQLFFFDFWETRFLVFPHRFNTTFCSKKPPTSRPIISEFCRFLAHFTTKIGFEDWVHFRSIKNDFTPTFTADITVLLKKKERNTTQNLTTRSQWSFHSSWMNCRRRFVILSLLNLARFCFVSSASQGWLIPQLLRRYGCGFCQCNTLAIAFQHHVCQTVVSRFCFAACVGVDIYSMTHPPLKMGYGHIGKLVIRNGLQTLQHTELTIEKTAANQHILSTFFGQYIMGNTIKIWLWLDHLEFMAKLFLMVRWSWGAARLFSRDIKRGDSP